MVESIGPQEAVRLRVLRLLQGNPRLNQRQIAAELGISLGRANYCLRALVDRGLVKIQNFQKHGNKLGYIYLLTPQGIAHKSRLAGHFLKLKLAEYESLREEIASIQAEIGVGDDTAIELAGTPE